MKSKSLSAKYVRELVSRVRTLPEDVKRNPGADISESEKAEDLQAGQTWTAPSGHICIETEKGTVLWGGRAAEQLLTSFDLLRVREGYRLDGYYFCDGMGGNFLPVAIPDGEPLPPWTDLEHNPIFQPEFLPKGLDPDVDPFVIPSGILESFFQKSIFMRELYSIGAWWHGCYSWNINGIITCRRDAEKSLRRSFRWPGDPETHSPAETPETKALRPRVSVGKDEVVVCFCVFSEGLGATRGIFRIKDSYHPDGREAGKTRVETLLDLGPGPTP